MRHGPYVLRFESLAERVGFEPTVEFPQHSLSRRAPSTARTPLPRRSLANVPGGHNRKAKGGRAYPISCMRFVLTPLNRPGTLSVLPEEGTVRSNILCCARSSLIGLLVTGMLNLPVMAASEKPVGMVVIADHAKLDTANATIGADVFSGDTVSTDASGSLRMSVGPSQVYLLSSTSASLALGQTRVQAKLTRGTLGFSTTSPDQLEITTPLAVIRGVKGQRVFAQVSILSPTKMEISAYEGSLVATAANGDQQTINEGETYEGTAASSDAIGGPNQYGVGNDGINWKHVALVAAFVVTLGLIAHKLWLVETESCTTPARPRHLSCDSD